MSTQDASQGLIGQIQQYLDSHAVLTKHLSTSGGLPEYCDPMLIGILEQQNDLLADILGKSNDVNDHHRQLPTIQRLLLGESIDLSTLRYAFELQHIGVVAVGPPQPNCLREAADHLGCQRLVAVYTSDVTWGWFAARKLTTAYVSDALTGLERNEISIGLGEPCDGLDGWCLTHQQAAAAAHIAARTNKAIQTYGPVAVLAAMMTDALFAESLVERYVAPLEALDDCGRTLTETVRAYFSCDAVTAAAAAQLKVNRRTLARRLKQIERMYDQRLPTLGAEILAALQFRELMAPDGAELSEYHLSPLWKPHCQ